MRYEDIDLLVAAKIPNLRELTLSNPYNYLDDTNITDDCLKLISKSKWKQLYELNISNK